jgi:dUTP pyrophosphatase
VRFDVHPGMKIAQLVIAPCLTVMVEESDELSGTARGQGGFGSSGI